MIILRYQMQLHEKKYYVGSFGSKYSLNPVEVRVFNLHNNLLHKSKKNLANKWMFL